MAAAQNFGENNVLAELFERKTRVGQCPILKTTGRRRYKFESGAFSLFFNFSAQRFQLVT